MLDEFSFRTLQLITSSKSSGLMEEINRAMDNLERYQVGFVNRLINNIMVLNMKVI